MFTTPMLIRHLWQLKTVVFLNWCLICADLSRALRQNKLHQCQWAFKNILFFLLYAAPILLFYVGKFLASLNELYSKHSIEKSKNSTVTNHFTCQTNTVDFGIDGILNLAERSYRQSSNIAVSIFFNDSNYIFPLILRLIYFTL